MLSIALPCDHAPMNGEDFEVEAERSVQVVQSRLAIMFDPTMPLPANNVNPLCLLDNSGSVWPCPPSLMLAVTLPFPSEYIRKIVAPCICFPIPKPTHWYVVGAEI